jgi:putative nucleotidyltransferase with HDIG domain
VGSTGKDFGQKMSNVTMLRSLRRIIFFVLLVLVAAAVAMAALMTPQVISLVSPTLQVGQVASQDYRAPEPVSFPSEVLTQQRRDAAVKAVAPVFTAADTSIARKQLEHLRSALAFISSVRADSYATNQQKLQDLSALEDVHLDQDMALNVLALSDARWQTVQQETIVVLEQVMRNTIRSDRLDDARNSVPSLVSLTLPEQQAAIVADLASAFVTPNSFFSQELTDAARQKASESVSPVTQTFMTGETIVPRGKVLTAADVEALQHLGLVQPQQKWQDFASAAGLVALLIVFVATFLRRRTHLLQETRGLLVMVASFLVFLLVGRLIIFGHAILPYAFPLATFSLTMAALLGPELTLILSLPLAILTAYGLPNALDLTLYYTLTSLLGVLSLGRARRVTAFFWAGIAIALSGTAVVVVYRLPQPSTDWVGLATLTGAAFFNGLASASLTVLLQFIFAQFLGLTTPMQLMELTRPDNPLLQLILREAPGTYQHSLQVANLAEQAAEVVGADALLTRVGALYHDAGKALNPIYFIENQVPGMLNPHDMLDPVSSADIIIRHVTEGLELARKNHLPRRIQDFILEHHGTMLTRYQYVQAVNSVGGDESQVDMAQFRYPGPRPQSRETAILMLADGAEARVRAEKPKEEADLRRIIKETIDDRVSIGELDDTDITLSDLSQMLESFTATLRGIYHPRITYPQLATPDSVTIPVGAALAARQGVEVDSQPGAENPSPPYERSHDLRTGR